MNFSQQKEEAHMAVTKAIRGGSLIRPRYCEDCGKIKRLYAHHPDYSKYLDVVWVCAICHSAIHKQINANKNYQLNKIIYPQAVEISRRYIWGFL